MKKTYIKPAMNQILVKSIMPLAESVTFSINDASGGDANDAASRGGSIWDDGNE